MDTYQPIYDAVRSRIAGFDGQELIDRIACNFDISHHVEMLKNDFLNVFYEMQRPSILLKPKIQIDGNQWCVLYGDDLQDGVAGFGDSPDLAMRDFDKEWIKTLNKNSGKE
jgi:hypothetical protein